MMSKWKESRETWTYQRKVTPCTRCGHPVHPTLAINQEGKIYCSECVKAMSLSSNLDDLEPREGESMDEWLVRWKLYREHCIDDQLAKVPSGPKKKVRFRLQA
ncbi:MAG: hypothetical protein LUP99_03690 [Methanomicrobiales archaeon]|nr:hypothetical protein [Methanomicrobiales archaeon]